MAGKSILQKIFNALQLSVDADVNCALTPRQCKELLHREREHMQCSDQLVKILRDLNGEIERPTFINRRVSTIPCCKCGGEVVEFSVPNNLWNIVMRKNGETDQEYLCFDCWNKILFIEITRLTNLLELERNDE